MTTPKDLIEGQLPSYFLEQYPQFTKFVQEYYNFLETQIWDLQHAQVLPMNILNQQIKV